VIGRLAAEQSRGFATEEAEKRTRRCGTVWAWIASNDPVGLGRWRQRPRDEVVWRRRPINSLRPAPSYSTLQVRTLRTGNRSTIQDPGIRFGIRDSGIRFGICHSAFVIDGMPKPSRPLESHLLRRFREATPDSSRSSRPRAARRRKPTIGRGRARCPSPRVRAMTH